MKRRLVQHWAALQHHLGRDPWQAGSWTLDEALIIESFATDLALTRRVAAVNR